MNESTWIYLGGVVLMVAVHFAIKWLSRGRVVLSYNAAEGILIAAITVACLVAAYVSGQFG